MFQDRSNIDPDARYPSECPRQVEALALRVRGFLPGCALARTRDAVQFDDAGDEGIVVLVTAEAIELRLSTVEWTCGPYGPAPASRLWKRVRARDLSDERLRELIDAARRVRQREFRRCRFCGERVPPEHRFDKDTCHGCASSHLQVVY